MHQRLIQKVYQASASMYHSLIARRPNGAGVHSPFLYRFITMVLGGRHRYYAFDELEQWEKSEQTPIGIRNSKIRIFELIFRIVQDLKPATILEIGATQGLETLYMARAYPGTLWCLAENEATCSTVLKAFNLHSKTGINLAKADTPESLKSVLKQADQPDLILFNQFDSCEKRLQQFGFCVEKVHDHALYLFLNIHQSREQHTAWKTMQNHPRVTVSIDLFSLGVLFFRPEWPQKKIRIKLKTS